MIVSPTEPTQAGRFFAYPADAVGAVADYWLASGGTKVRKTGACKRALLATFEAVIERAVVIANGGDSMSGVNDLSAANYATSDAPYCAVNLQAWGLAAKRAALGAKFARGCPQEEWDRLVALVWELWRNASRPVSFGMGGTLYAWQGGFLDGMDTGGWVQDGDSFSHTIDIQTVFDMKSTPCDNSVFYAEPQVYAPWGNYTGPQFGDRSVSEWLERALLNVGRKDIYLGSIDPQPSLAGDMMSGMSPFPLDTLAHGHLGNWMAVTAAPAAESSVRFSSAAWAVLQTMLANMRFTHLAFSYSATYVYTTGTRTWTRYWYMDPATLDIVVVDDADSPEDTGGTDVEANRLRSGSEADYLHGAAGADFQFGITAAQEGDLVLSVAPRDTLSPISDARDYLVGITNDVYGTSTAKASVEQTTSVDTVWASVGSYPAPALESYVSARGPVVFVDRKDENDEVSHSVHGETGGSDLETVARSHAGWLLSQVRPPRGYPSPAAVDTGLISSYSSTWWGSWKFVYPQAGQPNWPRGAANPTQYFPVGICNPDNDISWFADDNGHYVATCGAYFGTFALAFPDYPFGWDANESFSITAGTEALAGYKWQFKAMPTTG